MLKRKETEALIIIALALGMTIYALQTKYFLYNIRTLCLMTLWFLAGMRAHDFLNNKK